MPHGSGVFFGVFQNLVAIADEVFRDLPVGQREKRQDIHLCVPEIMPLVALAAESLGRDVAVAVLGHGLEQLVDVVGQRPVQLPVPVNVDLAVVPERVQIPLLIPVQLPGRHAQQAFQLFLRLPGRIAEMAGIAQNRVFHQVEAFSRLNLRGEGLLRQSFVQAAAGSGKTFRFLHQVFHRAAHGPPGFRGVGEDIGSALILPGFSN